MQILKGAVLGPEMTRKYPVGQAFDENLLPIPALHHQSSRPSMPTVAEL